MTRKERIVFSLKEKLERFSLRTWRVGVISFLVIVLMLWAMESGCHQIVALNPGSTVVDDHLLKELELDNARFEVSSQPPIQPGVDYWLTPSDTVEAKWDTFEHHWERVGTMCAFTTNVSTNDCRVCDYCNPPSDLRGPPCFGGILDTTSWKGVVEHEGFMITPNPKVIVEYGRTGYRTGCPNNTPASFRPETSGIYQIVKPDQSGAAAETKIHVIGRGMNRQIAYQLEHQIVDNTDYWVWSMAGDPKWLENFSANLRVTDIRILKGKCADGSAQGEQCAVPNESAPVKPSRLFFLPSYQGTVSGNLGESSHRCYIDTNASGDNFINLVSCRETYINPAIREKFATPTYEFFPARQMEKLTWLVEFNTSEGADAMPTDAELIIEFTIQAN